MSRLETMQERILEDLPEFVELIPANQKSEGLYRRIRHIQKTGECCGFKMSMDQLREVIAMASSETVKNPLHYLCRVLDRFHVERTLKTADKRLNPDRRVWDIIRYVKLEAEWQIKYLSDLITGKYSMNELMIACEIAAKKNHPDRYLLTMLKRGLKPRKNSMVL